MNNYIDRLTQERIKRFRKQGFEANVSTIMLSVYELKHRYQIGNSIYILNNSSLPIEETNRLTITCPTNVFRTSKNVYDGLNFARHQVFEGGYMEIETDDLDTDIHKLIPYKLEFVKITPNKR